MPSSAPAVRYPVARSLRVLGVLLLLWCLATAVLLWLRAVGSAPLAAWLGLGSLSVAVAVGGSQWHGMRPGALRWDGQAWWWRGDGAAAPDEVSVVSVQVRLDLQQGILLRLTFATGAVGWRFLERSVLPARWADLRRALYAPATDGAVAPALAP